MCLSPGSHSNHTPGISSLYSAIASQSQPTVFLGPTLLMFLAFLTFIFSLPLLWRITPKYLVTEQPIFFVPRITLLVSCPGVFNDLSITLWTGRTDAVAAAFCFVCLFRAKWRWKWGRKACVLRMEPSHIMVSQLSWLWSAQVKARVWGFPQKWILK